MYSKLRSIFKPFQRDYTKYLLGVFVRQALLVAGGYSLVLALRLCLKHTDIPTWTFVAILLVYDAGYLSFDIALNYLYSSRIGYPLFRVLRTSALGKVFQMPLEWHQRQNSGRLVGRVNDGVGKVVQTAEGVSRELCPALIQTGLSLIPLIIFSPITSPAIVAAIGLFMWLAFAENKKRQPYKKARYRDYAKDFGVFAESVQSVQALVQFGQTGRMLGKYDRLQRRIMDQGLEETRIGNRYGLSRSLVLSVAKRACQGIWIWEYRSGRLDAAMVMYLNMLTEQLLSSFWGYAALLERIYDGLEPAKILVKLLDQKPAIQDDRSARPREVPQQVAIRIGNVNFSYSGRNKVLRNFSLNIEAGSIVGIVGRSGCGKTTVHNLLSRMFDVQNGSIEVAGTDVRRWSLDQLRSLFSYVTQGGGIFLSDTSLLNTIRFARPDATFREVVHAARVACIHDDIVQMPQKYKTRIGQGGVMLSKGQQQRVALAQALLALGDDRKILVLDEFTSQLDAETEDRILQNLLPYLCGRTVIIIAHRLSTIRNIADKIVVVEEGEVMEEGTHDELMALDGWYSQMVRLQTSERAEPYRAEGFLVS